MAGKTGRIFLKVAAGLVVLVLGFLTWFLASIYLPRPMIATEPLLPDLEELDSFRRVGQNWLKRSESGLWEMYLEGDGYKRGVVNGRLTRLLADTQETVFIRQIHELVPSASYINFLKYFVAWFNRNMPDHISDEYLAEIYGVSQSASGKYDHLAPRYYRILNYHSAHDIGHALQDKNMTVGCTSFGVWNNRTEDGKLLIGRNFDFFAGEAFARNKIVCFTAPAEGNKFMYVTWAGFTGVVSGMNDKGLCVTINASKSEIPDQAATPISLLAKEILQYCSTIEQALLIAKTRKTFVSESILLGSARDKRTAIIEKTPSQTVLYSENAEQLICSNHFRSPQFEHEYLNNKNKVESSSLYRKFRMEELLAENKTFTPEKVAAVLRNQDGLHDAKIGLSNEKGINQLLAHHSIIFKPEEGLVWVSTSPYQLGKFVCYDLNKVFAEAPVVEGETEITEEKYEIPEDTFLHSKEYRDFLLFKQLKQYLLLCTRSGLKADDTMLAKLIESNPESYLSYQLVGDYYAARGDAPNGMLYYQLALSKEVATAKEANQIREAMNRLARK